MSTHQTPAPMTEGEAGFGAGQTPASPTVPLGEAGPHSSDADAVGAPASEGAHPCTKAPHRCHEVREDGVRCERGCTRPRPHLHFQVTPFVQWEGGQ